MSRLDARRTQLKARLAELEKRLGGIEDSLEIKPDPDVEERALEREDDEVLEILGLNALKELQMIRAALARIKDGTYGECVNCGDNIALGRLDLLPYTPLCHKCAG